MKVLLVNKFHFRKGGSETYYFTLAELLKKKGHEVIYFSIDDERNLECDDSKYFIKNAGLTGGIVGKILKRRMKILKKKLLLKSLI